jgi:predicted RNase H-like HicB family nuclease
MSSTDFYVRLPWTLVPSARDDDGTYLVLEVRELPGFIVTGKDEEEIAAEFWPALEAFIESYLEDGEHPPLPEGTEQFVEIWERSLKRPEQIVTLIGAAVEDTPRSGSPILPEYHQVGKGSRSERVVTVAGRSLALV